MLVYLEGPAVATRKHPLALDLAPQVKESRHLALIAEAEALHTAHPAGFDKRASTLKVTRHVLQLRKTRRGGHVILVWLWLSNGNNRRVAWLLGKAEDALCRTWQRVAWEDLRFAAPPVTKHPRRRPDPKPPSTRTG